MQPGRGDTATVSFYAAGIGVMFLLFSCAGAGGTLLEEEESGTLGRLIGSRAGMAGVLAGKWLFVAIMGIVAAHGDVHLGRRWCSACRCCRTLPGFFVDDHRSPRPRPPAFGLVLATLSRIARAALRPLHDRHPDDVGRRRQHVPAVPDERDDADSSGS